MAVTIKIVNLLRAFFAIERWQKRVITLASDFVMLAIAAWLAFSLRLLDAGEPWPKVELAILLAPLASIPPMVTLGTYRAVVRYINSQLIATVAKALLVGVALWALLLTLAQIPVPRSVLLIYWTLAVALVGVTRLVAKWAIWRYSDLGPERQPKPARESVLIYGVGQAGRTLMSSLAVSPYWRVAGFISPNGHLVNQDVLGVRVFDDEQLELLVRKLSISQVLLALDDQDRELKQRLVDRLESLAVAVKTVPSVDDIAAGRAKRNQLTELAVEDLLNRLPVSPDPELIGRHIRNQVVMVTGAGGSIGSELARQALTQMPTHLILFEQTEFALYAIDAELEALKAARNLNTVIVSVLGSVRNEEQLKRLMLQYKVNTLYHAAAYKHVPLVEQNPIEGLRNNLLGTWHAASAAIAAGVDNFVLVSTDKAVRPSNVMGASKRLAELAIQSLAAGGDSVRFSIVRFGNVLGSSGSVVPKFRAQIADGGPVTVTDQDVTRYFMTIPEAAQLVIQAGALGGEGQLFVLDMGQPVKILDLALRMIRLSGHTPKLDQAGSGDIEVRFTGLRPGEKLHEELLISGEVKPTSHPRITEADEPSLAAGELRQIISQVAGDDLPKTSDALLGQINQWLKAGS